MRSDGYGTWVVCVSFCVSVTRYLTSPMFFRLTNNTTYSTGNEGQNICVVFSENAPLQSEKANANAQRLTTA